VISTACDGVLTQRPPRSDVIERSGSTYATELTETGATT
jgi:hypothetical protein